jgi:hypothetical protein
MSVTAYKPLTAAPREVRARPWRATLHPPVLVYRGGREDHVTRPNLCVLDGGRAIGAIFQTTFDTSSTPHDDRHVCMSTDGGATWNLAARNLDIGSYSLFSNPDNGTAVVMPYDSIRLGDDTSSLTGPRATLAWDGENLKVATDRTVARFPEPLMLFAQEPIMDDAGKPMYLANDLPPIDKPITSFWGTIQRLDDGRWIVPMYGCYASDPRASDNANHDMRRMGRFTTELFVSADEGHTWTRHARLATPRDVPDDCLEGPCEVQLFRFDEKHWRAIFRTCGAKNLFRPMYYVDSADVGRTWTKARAMPESVKMVMDPRGLILPGEITVLSAGRPKIDIYLAEGESLDFHALDLTAHHNAYLPRLRTTGHTDVVALGDRSLLFVYDYIPDSWRWPGSPFTAPDAIYAVRVDIDMEGAA